MKKFLTILSVVFLSGTAISQVNEKDLPQDSKAKVESASKFSSEKVKGIFNFQLPKTATVESVNKSASFYTKYFTVTYNDKTKNANIKMVQDDAQGRHVILRFLVSNDVKQISMDGKDYDLDEFFSKYINVH